MSNKKGWPKKLQVKYAANGESHPLDQEVVGLTCYLVNKKHTAETFSRYKNLNEFTVTEMKINNERLTDEQIKFFFKWIETTIKEVEQDEARKKANEKA